MYEAMVGAWSDGKGTVKVLSKMTKAPKEREGGENGRTRLGGWYEEYKYQGFSGGVVSCAVERRRIELAIGIGMVCARRGGGVVDWWWVAACCCCCEGAGGARYRYS